MFVPDLKAQTVTLSPLTTIVTDTTLYVDNFGAIPNDGNDDKVAIQSAFNAARAITNKKVKLQFTANGTYILNDATTSGWIIKLQNSQNLLIEGNGAKMVITNSVTAGFLSIRNSTNIIVQNFYIDYNPLNFTQGTVTRINSSTSFRVQIDAGFTQLDSRFSRNANSNNAQLKVNDSNLNIVYDTKNQLSVSSYSSAGSSLWDVTLNNSYPVAVGQKYIQWIRYSNSDTAGLQTAEVFRSQLNTNISYINNTIYSGLGFSYSGFGCKNMMYKSNKTIPFPGRFFSTSADGIHLKQCFDVLIDSNEFNSQGDDCIALLPPSSNGTNQAYPQFNTLGRNFEIKNNIFKNIRRYGNIILFCYGVIENNTYDAVNCIAANLNGDTLLLQNNTFKNGFRNQIQNVADTLLGSYIGQSNPKNIKKITIQFNTFQDWHHANPIIIENGTNFTINDNLFCGPELSPIALKPACIWVENVSGLSIKRNQFDSNGWSNAVDAIYSNLNTSTNITQNTLMTCSTATKNVNLISVDIIVYPNPSKGFVTVESPFDKSTLSIYNELGQNIMCMNTCDKKTIVDLNKFKNGIYFIEIKDDNKTFRTKIIKN